MNRGAWVGALVGGFLVGGAMTALGRMQLRRTPGKEGRQDAGAVRAYDQATDCLLFRSIWYLMARELSRHRVAGTLLDVGCGTGQLALYAGRHFPGVSVVGLDNNRDMVLAARRHRLQAHAENIDFWLGDAHFLPLPTGSVDFVVSSLSLHHWQDPGLVFSEIARVLKPGGRLLLMDLRRDCRRWFYYALLLVQRLLAPVDIRRTNGALGSIYSSYTPRELRQLLGADSLGEVRVSAAAGWMVASARKPVQT